MGITEAKDYPKLEMPENVTRMAVSIWRDGIRLDADVYRPKALAENQKVPGVVLSHGWGGDKLTAERYAAKLAATGMIALSFTHSTWGESGGNLVLIGDAPKLDESNEATVRVRVIRDLIDPIDWAQNFRAATDYLEGEPNVDPDRIGAWGTSYGGGSAAYCAATDSRIKVLAIQVPMVFELPEQVRPVARQRAIGIARGEMEPVPQADKYGDAVGTPHYARMGQFDIAAKVRSISIPTLIIDAGNEELMDIKESGGAAYEALKAKGSTPVRYEIIEGIDHYGIYFDGYQRSSQLAQDWFVEHL